MARRKTTETNPNLMTVPLPSGRKVLIERATPLNFHRIAEALGGADDDDLNEDEQDSKSAVKLVCAFTVKPKFVALPLGDPKIKTGELSVDDLKLPDFLRLAASINEFGNISEAVAAVRPSTTRGGKN